MNNKKRIMWACFALVSITAFTCCGAPTGDPKTPPNSPVPEMDRKEPDPKKPPSFGGGDAG